MAARSGEPPNLSPDLRALPVDEHQGGVLKCSGFPGLLVAAG